jgi:hypothetical protein
MAIQLLTSHHLCIVCSCSVHLFMPLSVAVVLLLWEAESWYRRSHSRSRRCQASLEQHRLRVLRED